MDNEIKSRFEFLEMKYINERKKYWRNMIIFLIISCVLLILIIFVSLLFMDSATLKHLQEGNISIERNIDYLQFVVPILLTTAGFFLAFLGMNRLKDIDAQVDKIRIELKQDFDGEKKQLNELRTELYENILFEKKELQSHRNELTEALDQKIDVKTSIFREDIREGLRKEQEELVKGLKEHQEKGIDNINNIFDDLVRSIKDFQQQYGWLISYKENDDAESILAIGSVADAHLHVEKLCGKKPKNVIEIITHIVEKVIKNEIYGDEDDYHNLAAELARNNLYNDACHVCEVGISFFANNVDLLADWVNYASKIGKYDEAFVAIQKLNQISYNLWNWRAFDFIIDCYISVGKIEEADKLAHAFVEWMPDEERAYYSLAKVFRLKYGKKDGIIKEIEQLKYAVSLNINCPICANRLSEIMCEKGQLDDALEYINLCLKELAQEQPSVNYGYVVYRRALIYDRLYFESRDDLSKNKSEWADLAYEDYTTAIDSDRLSQITLNNAIVRRKLLAKFISKEVVLGDNSNIDIEKLLSVLSELDTETE